MGTLRQKHPVGYLQMAVGAEYIVIAGVCWQIDLLLGKRCGHFFYLASDPNNGRRIQTRLATAKEVNATKAAPAMDVAAAMDVGDWK